MATLNRLLYNGSHANYDNLVPARLYDITVNLAPEQSYAEVLNIIGEIRNALETTFIS